MSGVDKEHSCEWETSETLYEVSLEMIGAGGVNLLEHRCVSSGCDAVSCGVSQPAWNTATEQ